jgi:phospholipid/cholesterol/gamma-HCH transport system substrate-binding protein
MSRSGPAHHRGGVSIGGIVAIVAIAVGAVLALGVLLGGGDGHSYKLLFENGGQLVPGNEVLVGGQPIGSVDELTLTDEAQAEVKITVDEPLHEGTTAMVRATSLSGIANRYVSVHPGPNTAEELEDGTVIPADRTTSPVDLDQLFNTLDGPTRAALRDFIQGEATVYTGNNEAARETYKYFAPSLQAGERLFAELNRDQAALTRFLVTGSRVFGAVASRRDDLSALTENGNRALAAIAAENDSFDRVLAQLPPAMRQANTTFVNLRAALDDLDPLIADTGRVAPELPGFLRDLRPVAADAIPVFANLSDAFDRPGPDNDLADSLRDLPPAERSARTAVPQALAALDDSQHIFEFARPYSPDLLAFIGKLGAAAGYYDFSGHYIRAQPAGSNLFAFDAATEVLEPIAAGDMFDAYSAFGIGPFIRCPGGGTQANPGWPSPTDHPFLDDGNLAGQCEPAAVPIGP